METYTFYVVILKRVILSFIGDCEYRIYSIEII